MATNSDGSVTLKTTGKIAQTPASGAGTGKVTPVAAKTSAPGPKVVRVVGRGPVSRSKML